jgi:hypothetical protein
MVQGRLIGVGKNTVIVVHMCSINTLSYPAALLFFNFFTAAIISPTFISELENYRKFHLYHFLDFHDFLPQRTHPQSPQREFCITFIISTAYCYNYVFLVKEFNFNINSVVGHYFD